MKAERRHELQQNSLARFIENFPVMVRLYADRILLVIVLIMLVIVLVRWRMNAAAERQVTVANDLAVARTSVQQLQQMRMIGSPDTLATQRSKMIADINVAIDSVASNTGSADAATQARALLTRGDLYWTLANLPAIPGAATQPSLQLPKPSDEYLSQAADAYQNVLKNYPNQSDATLAANFGLAAIAENRHKWEEAVQIYNQIKTSNAEPMYKDLAEARLKLIPEIQQPVLLGELQNKPADLSPLMMAPASQPSSQPASQPTSAPATLPAQ
jgi:hypothetical protein